VVAGVLQTVPEGAFPIERVLGGIGPPNGLSCARRSIDLRVVMSSNPSVVHVEKETLHKATLVTAAIKRNEYIGLIQNRVLGGSAVAAALTAGAAAACRRRLEQG